MSTSNIDPSKPFSPTPNIAHIRQNFQHAKDEIESLQSTKLDSSSYNQYFKGKYATLALLQAANPTATAGCYAQVDPGLGSSVVNYNWDEQDGWVVGSGGSGASNTDALVEGSTNLYFTESRVRNTLLTGASFAVSTAIVATDKVIEAFGKIQAQINGILTNKADVNNAALTGIPTAPTALASTNTDQIATTAFTQSVNSTLASAVATALGLKLDGSSFTSTAIKGLLGSATSSVDGYLTSTDWSAFNAKQGALGFTPENTANKNNTALNSSTTEYPTSGLVKSELATVRAIAEGRSKALVFSTLSALNTWLAIPANTGTLSIGDNLYILALNTPDYWWDGTTKQLLETSTVDLTGYVPTSRTINSKPLSADISLVPSDISGFNSAALAAAPAETGATLAALHHAAVAKTTIVDGDEAVAGDSAASFGLIRVTWLNIYNYLLGKLNTVFQPILVSSSNIKSVNYNSLLGSGNLSIGETTTTVGTLLTGATSKTTPVDGDSWAILDSVSGLLQKVTGTNLKAYLKTYFDTVYSSGGAVTAPNLIYRNVVPFTVSITGTSVTYTKFWQIKILDTGNIYLGVSSSTSVAGSSSIFAFYSDGTPASAKTGLLSGLAPVIAPSYFNSLFTTIVVGGVDRVVKLSENLTIENGVYESADSVSYGKMYAEDPTGVYFYITSIDTSTGYYIVTKRLLADNSGIWAVNLGIAYTAYTSYQLSVSSDGYCVFTVTQNSSANYIRYVITSSGTAVTKSALMQSPPIETKYSQNASFWVAKNINNPFGLIKQDKDGNVIYRWSNGYYMNLIAEDSKGNFYIMLYISANIYLRKYDKYVNIVWTKQILSFFYAPNTWVGECTDTMLVMYSTATNAGISILSISADGNVTNIANFLGNGVSTVVNQSTSVTPVTFSTASFTSVTPTVLSVYTPSSQFSDSGASITSSYIDTINTKLLDKQVAYDSDLFSVLTQNSSYKSLVSGTYLKKYIQQRNQAVYSFSYTFTINDAFKEFLHPTSDITARTYTIPANSSVAFPVGTEIYITNQHGAGQLTISIITDAMYYIPYGNTGSRTLTANGKCTIRKETTTEWSIFGYGLV